jgi:hypothetical protein
VMLTVVSVLKEPHPARTKPAIRPAMIVSDVASRVREARVGMV